ncbi:MAG: L,D-transpeptidase [Bacteroidota bacterium]|nr:L,D-transpeptidase [Candidatus Kapabacteria bacterium]MDW8219029.1 L,D-transpeptidase [Bacteroidota bacterium]
MQRCNTVQGLCCYAHLLALLRFHNHALACILNLSLTIAVNACRAPHDEFPELEYTRTYSNSSAFHKQYRDSIRARAVRAIHAAIPTIPYRRIAIDSQSRLDSIRRAFANRPMTRVGYRVFTTLNRKDIQFFRLGDTVIIPAEFHDDLRMYSIFPHYYPAADTIAKLIVLSNAYQAYACYDSGKLSRFAACNTGREDKPTFPGRYALNWRDKIRRSSLDSNWVLPYTWNFHLYAGSAFHQFEMPGRPVSHSCVRQFMADAEWLFYWGVGAKIDSSTKRYIPMTGTPVIILDVFDYRRVHGGPWLDLTSNKDTFLVLPQHPMHVEEALIPMSQIPHEVRWELPNKERYIYAEDTLRKRGWIRSEVKLEESINFNKLRRSRAKIIHRPHQTSSATKVSSADSNSVY